MTEGRPIPRGAAHDVGWRTFAIVLQLIAPWSLASGPLRVVLVATGVALLISGMALVVRARRACRAHGQPTDPGRPTSELITTGVFAVSRNPL